MLHATLILGMWLGLGAKVEGRNPGRSSRERLCLLRDGHAKGGAEPPLMMIRLVCDAPIGRGFSMRWTRLCAVLLLCMATAAGAQEPCAGESLVSPMFSPNSFLIDMDLNIIKTWHCSDRPAFIAYLQEDGSILRPCRDPFGHFMGGGEGGRIQHYDANDNQIWDYYFSTSDYQQHHDIEPMPNGNVLLLAWELKTREEAIAAGRQNIQGEMWPTLIVEIEPVGPSDGNVVWEWHIWDHLIQDADPTKENYGVVEDHPELLDINLGTITMGDWVHADAIDYNPELDQIIICSHYMSELYVIDHSTTTEEAPGHSGGNSGMGGDILYRWGNPQNYRLGDESDRIFYVVHGVNWIDPGNPGAGNILIFNNGDRPGSLNDYSSVEEIEPPLDGYNYLRDPEEPFGPETQTWIYVDPPNFYSNHLSGAYRLPNGNTLITEGTSGYVFEVTSSGESVWDYEHPNTLARVPRYNMESTSVPTIDVAPPAVRLLRSHPNPFSPATRIPFQLDRRAAVRMEVFDIQGRLLKTLADAVFEVGRGEVRWDGRDAGGRMMPSGTYLVRLTGAGNVRADRLVLLR